MVNRRRFSYTFRMENLSYPIGKFTFDPDIAPGKRASLIRDIEQLPALLAAAVTGLSASQLDTPYRDGGWTIRQVVHHLADSQMNAFIRFKLGLTEDKPRICAFDQNAWAATADSAADVALSLSIIEGVHGRWAVLLRSLAPADFARTYTHPERGPEPLERTVQLYAWHGSHHLAHITGLVARKGWR
jgi:uncharacterized damage-inducible protein DinB